MRRIFGLLLLFLTAPVWAGSTMPGTTSGALPYLQESLIGNARGDYPNRSRGFVFGAAFLVNNTRVDLWEGPTPTYVFPVAAQQMCVVSTSASDTAAGTGIQKVHIHYLDGNYNPAEEQITTSGLTPHCTVATNLFRINSFHSVISGTGGSAAGNVSLTNVAGTVTYAFISTGYNTARQAIFTVPANVTGYINHWQTSSGSTGNHFCISSLRATTHDGVLWPTAFLVQDETGTQNTPFATNFPIPIPIPGKTDVKISAVCDAVNANATVAGAIMGWFEP